MTIINNPAEYVFDENYYAVDAAQILEKAGTSIPEHPPLGKLLISSGMALFGNNPLGWRIASVLFGTAAVILLYMVCRALLMPASIAVLVSFLFAFENLRFVQSSIAMLDIFSLTFMLAAFYMYLKGRYLSCGIFIAFSALSKFTGVFAVLVICLHWLITSRKQWIRFGFSIGVVPAAYLSALSVLLFAIWGEWLNPVTETINMLRINAESTFAVVEKSILSRPWEWLIGYEAITYRDTPHYTAMVSPSIWAVTIPAMLYMVYKAKKGSSAACFSVAWFAGTYLVWISVSLITDRTSFVFYCLPTVGAICLAAGLALNDINNNIHRHRELILQKASIWAVPAFVFFHLASFVNLSPAPLAWKLVAAVVAGFIIWFLFRFNTKESWCEQLQP